MARDRHTGSFQTKQLLITLAEALPRERTPRSFAQCEVDSRLLPAWTPGRCSAWMHGVAQPPPAARRVQIDASAESKSLLEASSRTPAVLHALGIPYKVVEQALGTIKPVTARLADIGAAALKMLLGTVTYLGQGDRRQVDVANWRLPDRTPQPTAPTADGLANEVTTLVRDTIAGAQAMRQRAAAAVMAGVEAWQVTQAALSALEEQQQQARHREEAMRAQHARELEEERSAAAISRAVLEGQLAQATAVAIAAKAVAEIATEERPTVAGADVVAAAAAMQCSQTLFCRPHTPGSALGEPMVL